MRPASQLLETSEESLDDPTRQRVRRGGSSAPLGRADGRIGGHRLVLTAVAPCWSQDRPGDPRATVEVSKGEKPAPPPEVVNAEKPTKQPADPLDGPPFTTVKAWAIADGRTGEILWGHHEKDPLEMASTTKIMTGSSS